MLALTSFQADALAGLVYTIGGALVVAVAVAVMRTFGKHQRDAEDAQDLRTFFFGSDANPRNGVPAKKGWTAVVDERQERLEGKVDEILNELKPDGNGGHNMRGAIDRTEEKLT